MPLNPPLPPHRRRSLIRTAALFVLFTGSLAPVPAQSRPLAVQAPAEELIARSWSALREGASEAALEAADAAIAQLASANDPEPLGRAHLARCAVLYALGRTREAAQTARSVHELDGLLERVDDEALPDGFRAWVRAAASDSGPRAEGPTVALGELNPEREIREVSSHFEMDVEIVRVPVIVEDEEGDFVTGLEAEHFAVVDGTPPAQPVYQLIREEEASSVGILIDASDAAREHAPAILQAVMQLIEQMRPEDEVFLLQFGDQTEFLSDFAPGGETLLSALSDYQAGGARVLRDALATGLIRMREAAHDKKSLVLLALGDDAGSSTAASDVRSAAQRDGVSIHALLLPADLDRWRPGDDDAASTFLAQRLAFETGGLVAIRPATAERYGGLAGWVNSAAQDVGRYIRHQYLLQFESLSPPPHGEWRELRVRVNAPEGEKIQRVRARSGYMR